MNSKELHELRQDVGDDVLRGFMLQSAKSVKNADAFTANILRARDEATKRGALLPPPLMDAFTMLLVAQSLIDQEIAGGIARETCVGILNPMLEATSDTWLRVTEAKP